MSAIHTAVILLSSLSCPRTWLGVLLALRLRESALALAVGGVEEHRVVANPHQALEKAKGIRVAEWPVAQKVDVVVLQEDVRGKGPEYVLRDTGVELRHTDRTTIAEALAPRQGAADRTRDGA